MDTDAHSLDYLIRCSHNLTSEGYSVDGVSAATVGIIIEYDVLIGTRCIILKRVTIGARSVIGSGSVVTISNRMPQSRPSAYLHGGEPSNVLRQTIFQSAPNDFSISAKRFSDLRQTIFRSPQLDFPLSSKGNETWLNYA